LRRRLEQGQHRFVTENSDTEHCCNCMKRSRRTCWRT
jgi:hypothetical protein